MKQQSKLLLTIVFTITMLLSVSGVMAQDSNEVQIFNRTRSTQKIEELKILYRDQIEAYRQSDKEFNVAKTNYFNVETLRSLEDAVDATQVAMFDRSKILITYLELLSATLDDSTGIELTLKEESLKQIRNLIVDLKLHQEKIEVAEDRSAVNILADDFEVFVNPYNQVAYRALSLIRIGKMQSVYDAAVIIDSDIKSSKESSESGAVIEAKITRAYQEIQRNFSITNNGLIELNSNVLESKEKSFGRSFYERVLRDLEPIYIQMSKSLDHLEELLKL